MESVKGWQPIESCPRDGTLVLLLVPIQDEMMAIDAENDPTPAYTRTIGFCDTDYCDPGGWHLAGWDWSHDCFCAGTATAPRYWQPLPAPNP